MEWTTYALIAAGCLGTISLVMGLIDSLVWKRWEAQQRSQHLAWLEDEARAQRLLARSLRAELDEVRVAFEERFLDGYDKGFDDGLEQQPDRSAAFVDGYDEGHKDGHTDGYDHGFSDGYDMGYTAGRDGEHKYWTERAGDECDPFGLVRPEGAGDEPDNGDPAVIAAINGALAEAPEGCGKWGCRECYPDDEAM